MGFSIEITTAALEFMKNAVEQEGCVGMRVDVKAEGCQGMAYALDFVVDPDPTDLLIEKEELKLYVTQKASVFVAGMTMDYIKSPMGGNLVFANPNAKRNCGCGKSFCVDENSESACSKICGL